jgi:hypothetical protein
MISFDRLTERQVILQAAWIREVHKLFFNYVLSILCSAYKTVWSEGSTFLDITPCRLVVRWKSTCKMNSWLKCLVRPHGSRRWQSGAACCLLLLASCLAYSSTLKMETTHPFEKSVDFHRSIRREFFEFTSNFGLYETHIKASQL